MVDAAAGSEPPIHGTSGFAVRRVYDDERDDEGYRVLVDRLWPRGVTKQDAALDEWCKDVAPSAELRRWFGHDPDRFVLFGRRYRHELGRPPGADSVVRLRRLSHNQRVVLLTATRDVEHSGARALQDYLDNATDV